jgi:hypothetical protein
VSTQYSARERPADGFSAVFGERPSLDFGNAKRSEASRHHDGKLEIDQRGSLFSAGRRWAKHAGIPIVDLRGRLNCYACNLGLKRMPLTILPPQIGVLD